MFTPLITWLQFLIAYAVIVVVYYSVFFFASKKDAFRKQHITPGNNRLFSQNDDAKNTSDTVPKNSSVKDTMLSNKMNDLVDEIRSYIEEISSSSFTKQEILQSLSIIVHRYFWITDPIIRSSIESMVAVEVEMKCNLQLQPSELTNIWS